MAEQNSTIHVQICYATHTLQVLHDLNIQPDITLQQAILQSGILRQFPEIDLSTSRVGIYGKLKPLDTVLRNHDRVEIYRPLVADPKDSRRQRAIKKGNKKAC